MGGRQLSPSEDGLTLRCRFIGTTQSAPYIHHLPRLHRGFRENFDLLLDAITHGLVVEVVTEDEPDEAGRLTVESVSLNGHGFSSDPRPTFGR
jgi:hypothetical protein